MQTEGFLTGGFLDWLPRTSWQTAILVALVLLSQRLLRRWLTPRWRHALWWLVMARLLLPAPPASGVSVFNWLPMHVPLSGSVTPPARIEAASASTVPRTPQTGVPEAGFPPDGWASIPASPPDAGTTVPDVTASAPSQVHAQPNLLAAGWSWRRWWPWLWLAGALALAGRVTVTSLQFQAALRRSRPVRDAGLLALRRECCACLGVRREPVVFETEWVRSPALAGLWHPRLLLPAGLLSRFSSDELRHVLLHELAHLKRATSR